jgi:hypothetical protein
MNEEAQNLKDIDYCVPYCEVCWSRGFATPARVTVGNGDQRKALCIGCHGDYERDKDGGGSGHESWLPPKFCADGQ